MDACEGLTDGELGARPGPDKWSILEIIEHLVRADHSVLGDLTQPPGSLRTPTLKHKLAYRAVLLLLRSPLRVRTPSAEMDPNGTWPRQEVLERWADQHHALRAYVQRLSVAALDTTPFHHPIAGPLRPAEAVEMLEVHTNRHVEQIRERIRALP